MWFAPTKQKETTHRCCWSCLIGCSRSSMALCLVSSVDLSHRIFGELSCTEIRCSFFFIVLSVKPRPLRARHERAHSFTFSLMKGSLSKRSIGFPLCLSFLRNHVASSATVPSYNSIYLSSLLLLSISAALLCETESECVSHPFLSSRWCDFITW